MLPAIFQSPPKTSDGEAVPPPFVLELRSRELQNDGTFTPEAAVLLTPALLESGLLLALSPTELQTLLMVLSCVTSNGNFIATSEALASRLRLWPGQMRGRLEKLMARTWNGEPLLRSQTTESGLRLFAPSSALFTVRRTLVFAAPEGTGDTSKRFATRLERPAALQHQGARLVGGLREAVVEHSRAAYGRPRAEVEAEINRFLSRDPFLSREAQPNPQGEQLPNNSEPLTPEEMAKQKLGGRLTAAGLGAEQARFLVDSFPAQTIERQLEYLPYRHARNPAGMLVASIEGDYAPPLGMRAASSPSVRQDAEIPERSAAEAAMEELPREDLDAHGEVLPLVTPSPFIVPTSSVLEGIGSPWSPQETEPDARSDDAQGVADESVADA